MAQTPDYYKTLGVPRDAKTEDIKKAFEIKKGEDYEMYSNWLGVENLDLNVCDLEDLNFRLKKLPRIFRESYEYGLEPTERSIKLLERGYK